MNPPAYQGTACAHWSLSTASHCRGAATYSHGLLTYAYDNYDTLVSPLGAVTGTVRWLMVRSIAGDPT
jgi:hypothetical protein